MSEQTKQNYSAKVVDLFCGIGGLSYGFVKEGFNVVAGIDSDETCRFAYEANNAPFYRKSVEDVTVEEINNHFVGADIKILVGCAPCQPFSIYTNKTAENKKEKEDSKWKLLSSFADLIEAADPDIISMENVSRLISFKDGAVFNNFIKRLENKGYTVSWFIVNARDYGIPQRRKRLILFGSKFGKIDLIKKTFKKGEYKTVRQAIGHLPPVEGGVSHPTDPLHRARKLSDLNIKRIQATSEGGFWRDWDEELLLECHKKETGNQYRSVYGRMKWDEVAPTMTTYCIGLGNGRFGHPSQDRAITLREAAIFQSFPDDYIFFDPKKGVAMQIIARHIGNAVPVDLGKVIAKSIKNHIEQFKGNQ